MGRRTRRWRLVLATAVVALAVVPLAHAALARMPEDVRIYSTAPVDIERALLAALRGRNVTAR